MADKWKMLPFVFHFAAGVYGKDGGDLELPVEEQFEIARKRGWSDDPDDPGGATMIDVTLATYATYCRRKGKGKPGKRDLKAIAFEEWTEIFRTMFWNLWRGDEIRSQGVAHLLVDWVWASGQGSIRRAQKILGVKADGVVGPKTLAAINSAEEDELFRRLMAERERYYRGCRSAWKYLGGWLRRLHAIRRDGSFLICGKVII